MWGSVLAGGGDRLMLQQQVPARQVVQERFLQSLVPGEGLLWDAGAVEHLLLSLVFCELCVCCGRARVDF